MKPGRGRSYRVEAMTSQVHSNTQCFKCQVLLRLYLAQLWTLKAVPPIHASETMWKKKTSQRSSGLVICLPDLPKKWL